MLLISRHGRLRYDLQPLVSVFEQRCQHADTILLDFGPYLCSPASITNSQIFELSMSVPDSSSRASPTLRSLDATSCTDKTEKPCDIYAGAEYPKGLTLVLISMALCFSIIIGGLVSIMAHSDQGMKHNLPGQLNDANRNSPDHRRVRKHKRRWLVRFLSINYFAFTQQPSAGMVARGYSI
jgi:hypothetical protein